MAGEERAVKVQIQNIKMAFNGRKGEMVALNGVDLDIHENEFVTVVGPSGCGKSTLLNIIAGLLKPTSGTVLCDGEAVEGVGRERGVVFQQYALFPWLTVEKNVCFALEMRGIKGAKADEEALRYLRMVDLEKFAEHYPKELSGGMKQRVAIARAYVNHPQILLADEPTGNLDPVTAEGIMRLFQEIAGRGCAVVMSTHNTALIENYPARAILFAQGHIREVDLKAELG